MQTSPENKKENQECKGISCCLGTRPHPVAQVTSVLFPSDKTTGRLIAVAVLYFLLRSL